ncbi:hypothetical protein AMJ47_02950 [Parcubacteria bacterium DG_72]|nr:MAG: hypothetical protein AMJ47_02950 [Parcubacteria bacterium DG_72]
MFIILSIISLIFSLMALSQIIYPLFLAWPMATRLEKEGKLKKKIPIFTFLIPPLIWVILIILSVWLVNAKFPFFSTVYYSILVFILIIVIIQIPLKNRNLKEDFEDSWGKYLKDQTNNKNL